MFNRKLVAAGVAGALGLIVTAAPVHAAPVTNRALEIVGAGAAADPLIAVEANRSAIVDRIVADHADVIATMGNGAEAALRTALAGLRADQLLAASLVGSLAEVTAIISGQSSDGAALQRFVALAPAAPSSALPSAQAYLVRNADTLTIVAAADLAASGGQVVGYFTSAGMTTAGVIAPKDGSGTGTNSWIGYTAGGNVASGSGSAVAGGTFNVASGTDSAIMAGTFNAATNTNASIFAGHSNVASGISALVIGGFDNHATAIDALVGGGAGSRATGARSIVVGGGYNLASGQWSFVGGGGRDGTVATPAGSDPKDNIASGNFSVVTGGQGNRATGLQSTIPGGSNNVASGANSVAMGSQALTQDATPTAHSGAFVFSDGSSGNFRSFGNNTFNVLATGGVRLVTKATNVSGEASPLGGIEVNSAGQLTFATLQGMGNDHIILPGTGVKAIGSQTDSLYMRAPGDFFWYWGGTPSATKGDPGGGEVLASLAHPLFATSVTVTGDFRAQTITATSDRNQKTGFAPVDAKAVLVRVNALPITTWSFKNEAEAGIRHIGPMSQDFKQAFDVGADERSIATVDAGGVALAAIQGLYAELKERDATTAALQQKVGELVAAQEDVKVMKAALAELLRGHGELGVPVRLSGSGAALPAH